MRPTPTAVQGAGIALILVTAAIHFIDAPGSFGDATYKGVLFLANGIAAVVAAFGIHRGERTWGWGLGVLVAGGALVAYVTSRTVGLPGLVPDVWLEPFYESDCPGHTSASLIAGHFCPAQSAPTAEGAQPGGASGSAGQSVSSASFASIPLPIRLDESKRWGRTTCEPWFYRRLGTQPA